MREMRGATARAITGMTPVERTSGVIFVPGIGVTLECAPAFASMHRGRCGRTGAEGLVFRGAKVGKACAWRGQAAGSRTCCSYLCSEVF